MNSPGRTMTRQPQQRFRTTAGGGTCTRIPVKAGIRVIVAVGAMPRAIAHYCLVRGIDYTLGTKK